MATNKKSPSAASVKELYDRRKKAGVCMRCGGSPLVTSRLCEECRQKNNAYMRQYMKGYMKDLRERANRA